jgi:hypothetical protein
MAVTLLCIRVCFAVRRHYRRMARRIHEIEQTFKELPHKRTGQAGKFDPQQRTAVVLVGDYEPLANHSFLTAFRLFPEVFHNVAFATVGIIDSGLFEGGNQLGAHQRNSVAMRPIFQTKRRSSPRRPSNWDGCGRGFGIVSGSLPKIPAVDHLCRRTHVR